MRFDQIPQVSGASIFGHVNQLRRDRFGFFERINRECGDIARASLLGTPVVLINSPALLHEVLVQNSKSFIKSQGVRGPLRPIAGEGLFTGDGPQWQRHRKMMAPLFTGEMIAGYAPTMAECARDAIADLRAGDSLDAADLTTRITMRVAGKTLLGIDVVNEVDELGAALTVALRWVDMKAFSVAYAAQLRVSAALQRLSQLFPAPMRGRGEKIAEGLVEPIRWPGKASREIEGAVSVIQRHVQRMIDDRRKNGVEQNDLLSLLLHARDDEGGMTDKQIQDEIVTLFVAGHETTANALAWSFYLLARHPEAYARAAAEARSLAQAEAADVLTAPPYCLRVFKEAMRLYPPVYFFGRQAICDVRIGDYEVPSGTAVLFNLYGMQRRPDLWPEPYTFDPDRFSPEEEEKRHKLAWMPFGAGPRTCLGNHFGLLEGPIVIATVLRQLDFEVTTEAEIIPDECSTLRPKGGVPVRVSAVH